MKARVLAFVITGVMLLFGRPTAAHHSFGGTYDVTKRITLKGVMAQVALRSPHSFFFVDVKDEGGKVQRWAIEGAGASQFAQQGINRNTFKIGDPVEILANPSRTNTTPRARLLKITRTTDGWTWGNAGAEVVD
jgi:hypothetical protein